LGQWREILEKLGLVAARRGLRKSADTREDRMKQPELVDPGELALILLRNAVRILDQSHAPPDVRVQLEAAIMELEKHVSGRPN
jgi:hypothetical protein